MNSSSGSFFIWIMIVLLYFGITIFTSSSDFLESTYNKQVDLVKDFFGDGSDEILKNAEEKFNPYLEGGVYEKLRRRFFTEYYIKNGKSGSPHGNEIKTAYSRNLDRIIFNVLSLFRICVLMFYVCKSFFFYFLVMIIVGLCDGLFKREIKRYGYEHTSPARFALSINFMTFFLPLSFVYLFFPVFTIPIWFLPLGVMFSAFVLNQFGSNLIKRL